MDWWEATTCCLSDVVGLLCAFGTRVGAIAGLSVTSTSGTVCLVDAAGESVGPALMYNDQRAMAEADEVNQAGATLTAKLGYRFPPSWALPKLLWLRRHDVERFQAVRHFLSPTDFIIGRLTGEFGITDYSNALKTGYDLVDGSWPGFIVCELGIPADRLPAVVAPGAFVGHVCASAACTTGLAEGIPVLAGMTDGCASQVSTGAVAPGQWNSTLGTTLVIKGVTRDLLRDPLGRVYCHRHPDGHWLPGGASNTGGECIARRFGPDRLSALNALALERAPTDLIIYPLVRLGERFPFAKPEARGFTLGEASDEATDYAAYLEGVGYVERLAYEVLAGLGAEVGGPIYAAGGATQSSPWLQLRADILSRQMLVPENSGGAMGAAIVAAGSTIYPGIVPAARAMVRIVQTVDPRPSESVAYDERYARFLEACRERGYIGDAAEQASVG
jgi:xylulokinase